MDYYKMKHTLPLVICLPSSKKLKFQLTRISIN